MQERRKEKGAARILERKRDLLFVFVLEIFAVFLIMVQSPVGSRVEPLHFLRGLEYDWNLWDSKEMEVWFLQMFLFTVVVLRHAEQYREETSYMQIVRYCSWRRYYQMVLHKITLHILEFHFIMIGGIFCGSALGYFTGWDIFIDGKESVLCLVCFTFSNFFFGILSSYCVVHLRSLKCSLVIYPVLPMLICFLRDIPGRMVGNILPANWAMLARSDFLETGGFRLLPVLGVELFMILAIGSVFVHVRSNYILTLLPRAVLVVLMKYSNIEQRLKQ